jgi:hypothetical protein
MKRTFLNFLVLMNLFMTGTVGITTANPPASAVSGDPSASAARLETHPMIRRAIGALEAAKGDLQAANHDFCGHREDALESVNNALTQLRAALASDRSQIIPREDPSQKAMFVNASFDSGDPEKHPKIKQAIRALENARSELQNAAHDFKGHRAEALEATNTAISRLQQAIACDRG